MSEAGETLLEARDLVVAYGGEPVLQIPHLEVRRRETVTLVGHNGSGKSTLLRVLGLLLRPTSGEVFFEGEKVDYDRPRRLLELRRRMSGVLQEPLLCRMSVYQNVALGLKFRKERRGEIARRVGPWLERLRIAPLRDRHAGGLSGGEAQRASLARAFVLRPEVLLLDEPFAALDKPSRDALLAEFLEILAEERVTTLFATHDRGEALALGHRVAVLIAGELVQIGPPEEIFCRPATEEVARFVGAETLIPGRTVSSEGDEVRIETGQGELRAAGTRRAGEEVLLCVRPEDVTIAPEDAPPGGEGENVLAGRIVKITPADSLYRIAVDCGVPVVAAVTRPAFQRLGLETGRAVRVSFPPARAHLIRR